MFFIYLSITIPCTLFSYQTNVLTQDIDELGLFTTKGMPEKVYPFWTIGLFFINDDNIICVLTSP